MGVGVGGWPVYRAACVVRTTHTNKATEAMITTTPNSSAAHTKPADRLGRDASGLSSLKG